MITRNTQQGFTILEFVIVVSILGIITGIVFAGFYQYQKHHALEMAANRVVGIFEEARNLTMSSKNDTRYGVHIHPDEVILFQGNSYIEGTTVGSKTITLRQGVTISSITLNGGVDTIVFDRLTGGTTHYGTTTLSVTASTTETIDIVVHRTGLIQQL